MLLAILDNAKAVRLIASHQLEVCAFLKCYATTSPSPGHVTSSKC